MSSFLFLEAIKVVFQEKFSVDTLRVRNSNSIPLFFTSPKFTNASVKPVVEEIGLFSNN